MYHRLLSPSQSHQRRWRLDLSSPGDVHGFQRRVGSEQQLCGLRFSLDLGLRYEQSARM